MTDSFSKIYCISKREIVSYFTSPLAYVFIIIFLILSSFFTFRFGAFFQANEASLNNCFFPFHPWLYLLLVPAVAMRLWAEENRTGTIELLFTMPLRPSEAVIAKFAAAWLILLISLVLTFPLPLTVFYLGSPDSGQIFSGYLASFLLSGAFLSVGSFTSASSRSQVVSFIFSLVVCLLLIIIGHTAVTDYFRNWAPEWVISMLSKLSVMPHYETLRRGVLDLRDIIYFLSVIIFFLFSTTVILNTKKN
ncbi:MAG TPA: ABC transporter permease [Victivallales bacterium]|nr:ABC transporter permease [Victivallales bacterium]HRR29631.1 ABC transporter permease [Victivallales bacterium]HRU01041.1 ABC transporter permease [Victivallales bacterium]